MRVLVVDNYDSFTYNLVQMLGELGADLHVVRNDRAGSRTCSAPTGTASSSRPARAPPTRPGSPSRPSAPFPEAGVPTLGVCLGHQSLAQAYGAAVVRHEPVHGKTTTIEHDGRSVYAGLEAPLTVGRYHSLVVDPATLPDELRGDEHRRRRRHGHPPPRLPAEGVQFHPESVLTPEGVRLLANFLGGPAT